MSGAAEGWGIGQEKVSRTPFCVSGCGDTVCVFLQLLPKEMACGGGGGRVRGLGLRRLRAGRGRTGVQDLRP